MDKFDLIRSEDGDRLRVPRRGTSLLRFPLYNKGTAFSDRERKLFGLEGLLPSRQSDIDAQAERVFRTICIDEDLFERHLALATLQDHNEHLYYRVLSRYLEDLMPVIYTPTVGKASQYYSRVFRPARGIWLTPEHRGRIEKILRKAAPFSGVQLMVVTDNESILGIGDQGCGGMAISIGKLALYCAGAGIHPARTLPISLDVGTNNRRLLDDPLYLGWREPRLRGEPYQSLVDEFVEAAKSVFPEVLIQWEDFRKDNALAILNKYRDSVPSFNDDMQGTGAVVLACVLAADRIKGTQLKDNRMLIFGAGAAGLGIARQLKEQLRAEGVDGEQLTRSIIMMDSRGILSDGRPSLDAYKEELAWPEEMAAELELNDAGRQHLDSVVHAYKPHVLIGTSGQAGAFDETAVRSMAAHVDTPVILPLSNPSSLSEATPEDILRWTSGRALVATGSPFEDVELREGVQRIGQANNVFVFPGLGLGTIVSGASRVSNAMINRAALALSQTLTDEEIEHRCLMPEVTRLWEVCGAVGLAVAEQAVRDGVANKHSPDDLRAKLADYRWRPEYPEFVRE